MSTTTTAPRPAPAGLRVWVRALRAYSLPASLVPLLVGVALVHWRGHALDLWTLPLLLLAGVAVHLGTNLTNDAVDFRRGVDTADSLGGSGVLTAGELSPRQVQVAAALAFFASVAAGAALVYLRGLPLLAIGLAGVLGGVFYTAPPLQLKYRALGEPLVFWMMGPLMAAGAALAASGALPASVWWGSVPVGLLVTAILTANNVRDRAHDARSGVKTLATLLSPRVGRVLFALLVAGTYLSVPLLALAGHLPWTALLTALTLPLALPLVRAVLAWIFGAFALIGMLNTQPDISRAYLFLAAGSGFLVLQGWRMLFHRFIMLPRQGQLKLRTAFFGWTSRLDILENALAQSRVYLPLGWIQTSGKETRPSTLPLMGNKDNLEEILRDCAIDVLFVPAETGEIWLQRIQSLCAQYYVHLALIPQQSFTLQSLSARVVKGQLFLQTGAHPLHGMDKRMLKRLMDIVGAVTGLVLTLPVMAVLAVLIKRESRGPAFYGHTRIGQYGKPFTIWKLRSMRTDAEANGPQWATENDPRRTRIGTFMRKWNLDELPQFWNVLKGDMSLIGPRPERPEFTQRFECEIDGYNPRHAVRPGMSGWAQVHGLRGDTDLRARIKFDLYYIEHWTLWLDIQILILTFLHRDNAY